MHAEEKDKDEKFKAIFGDSDDEEDAEEKDKDEKFKAIFGDSSDDEDDDDDDDGEDEDEDYAAVAKKKRGAGVKGKLTKLAERAKLAKKVRAVHRQGDASARFVFFLCACVCCSRLTGVGIANAFSKGG